MDKTEEFIRLRIPTQAIKILRRNGFEEKEPSDLLLPILPDCMNLDNYKKVKQAISARGAYINKILKRIMNKLSIDKNVSMHTARHTFPLLA